MNIKHLFSKSSKAPTKKCDCNSIEECPYSSPTECKFDKAYCHLKNGRNKPKKSNKRLSPVVVFGLLGLIVYILTVVASRENTFAFSYSEEVYKVIGGIALSVLTGSILAILIDLPSRLSDYEQSFVNALASNNYLKSLDESRLTNLRNEITEQLHKTKAPKMAKGLIKIDQNILELLRQPYYEYYRHSVRCELSDDGDSYIKFHNIEYKLVNPYSINRKAVEYIKLRNLLLLDGEWDDSMLELNISCQTDDEETPQDLSPRIKLIHEPRKGEFYNTSVILSEKGNINGIDGIRVEFSDNIKVRMSYTIIIGKSDPCFTKRIQHPAKNFRLDYQCEDSGIKLYGQLFGTQLKQSAISVNYHDGYISLETFDWLLPANGAIVVMLKR